MASLATPKTILRGYGQMVAAKYDGAAGLRGRAHRRSPNEAVEQILTQLCKPLTPNRHTFPSSNERMAAFLTWSACY